MLVNNSIDQIQRYKGMCLTFNTYPLVVTDGSVLFEVEGYKYISFGFDYTENDVSELKRKISKGDINQLDILTTRLPMFSPYHTFIKFAENYKNVSVNLRLFPTEFRYNAVHYIDNMNVSNISTQIVGYEKVNNVEISLVTKHKPSQMIHNSSLIEYIFWKMCDEIINFMVDYYDPLYNSKKYKGFTDYIKMLCNKKELNPLNNLFKEKEFSFKDYDIINYINKAESVIVNISIK